MHPIMTIAYLHRLFLLSTILFCSAVSIHPQTVTSQSRALAPFTGRWTWKQIARRHRPQSQFTIVIKRKGNVVSGTYSVDEFINGAWQGQDGNQTPFQGRLKGAAIEIEFDPQATVPGYQEHVAYQAPADGRKPSLALLTFDGKTLRWRLIRGPGIEGVPNRLALYRERPRR